MLVDLDDLPDGHVFDTQICIVGAGAAGIAMALRFIDSGQDVVLLEAGSERPDVRTQALYEGSVEDERAHSPLDRFRQRRFGGSTTIWGGRCMPFDAIDFEPRPYVPHSGWPIGLDTLMPFYPEANRICEAGEFAYRAADALPGGGRPMIEGFASSHFTTDSLERFSCPTDFGARYGHKLRAASRVQVVLHANVTALSLDPDGRSVVGATVRTLAGKTGRVKARRFVLATGGLEVPRLLLASRDVAPAGIGNDHDVLGRYYMCHLAGTIGTIRFDDPSAAIWHGYDIADDGTYCRKRIALSAETQRQLGLGNFIARLHHPRITDPTHRSGALSLLNLARLFVPYEYGRRLHGAETQSLGTWIAHVRNVVVDAAGAGRFVSHWLRNRTFAARKFPSIVVQPRANRYSLDFHAEQRPDPDSRVRLADQVDALGMPKLHADWRYASGDLDTVKRALDLLASDLERSGVARFEYDPEQVELEMTRYGAYGGHHIGTARMGDDPRTSVVDADCRVHGIANLFIASAAVFPTSSQANPTLTLVALALRLAAHLRAGDDHDAVVASGADAARPVRASEMEAAA